ncbi:MAG: matrixin family metalloprotease, partial [Acidobacteria bacterium]|nr:matrixin family metalloprotease [Acidobacteriota bacterium]
MRRALTSLCLSALLLLAAAPRALPYTQQFTGATPIRWGSNTITVTLAPSITAPPANFKAGSDVNAAVRRALQRWSDATNITFNVVTGGPDAIPASNDGVNTISVSTANASFVASGGEPLGRTRVSFDTATGGIVEADIALNPGTTFSTDATNGTYDVEAVFVHEIGHFLGLNHSALVGASMSPRIAQNFSDPNTGFTLTQTTPRTLSDDDLAGIRSIYGQRNARDVGSIQGATNYPFAGAHVWAENTGTGRAVGSAITRSDGSFRIDQVPPGTYRVNIEYLDAPVFPGDITSPQGPYANLGQGPPFQSSSTTTTVAANATSNVVLSVLTAPPAVNLRTHGLNGIMHGGPMPLVPGTTYRYYVGGNGVDQIPAANFTVDSPFFQINAATFQSEPAFASQLGYPVVSFDLTVRDNAKVGDYSLHVRTAAGESAYLAGALAVDPYTDRVELNPIDAVDFFVRQQYRDFFFREPDPEGFATWTGILNGCPNQNNSVPTDPSARCDRSTVSSAFFLSTEFQLKGFYAYRFYRLAFARQPSYNEISADMRFLSGSTSQEVFQKRADYAAAFVNRAEFQATYGGTSNDTYVNRLMDRYQLASIRTPNPATPDDNSDANKVVLTRAQLIGALNAGSLTRAQVVRAIADSDQVGGAEQNNAFVSMQYVG